MTPLAHRITRRMVRDPAVSRLLADYLRRIEELELRLKFYERDLIHLRVATRIVERREGICGMLGPL